MRLTPPRSATQVPRAPSRRRLGAALAGVLACTAGGCGAKTGLNTPDVLQFTDVLPDRPNRAPVCLDPRAPGTSLVVDLSTDAHVAVADVLFVIDRTGSMDQEIDNIRAGLRSVIVPGLARSIEDLNLGVVTYGDFPIEPYGAPEETPFTLVQSMTRDVSAVQGALQGVRAGFGGDNPESMVEALYQVATGDGLGRFIERAGGCPSVGLGYACLRPRAQPIVVLFTDAPAHNGPVRTPGGTPAQPYSRQLFAPDPVPHTYDEAVAALVAVHARVIGINSGVAPFSGRDDLESVARDTGAVGQNGAPLVFDIGADGSGLGPQVVTAVQRFTEEVRFDAAARAIDVDGSGGADLVASVRPLRAEPMSQIARFDAGAFYRVLPGTRLVFALELDPTRVVLMDVEQRFNVRVEFLADGRPTLGFRDVEIVVPARGSPICPR